MIRDNQTGLWEAAALTATAVSDHSYDMGSAKPDLGIGQPIGIAIAVTVAADHTTGDETYEFDVIQSANADLSSADILRQAVIAAASLTAGTIVFLPIPPGALTKQYLGAKAVLGGTTPSVTVTAWVTLQEALYASPFYKTNIVVL